MGRVGISILVSTLSLVSGANCFEEPPPQDLRALVPNCSVTCFRQFMYPELTPRICDPYQFSCHCKDPKRFAINKLLSCLPKNCPSPADQLKALNVFSNLCDTAQQPIKYDLPPALAALAPSAPTSSSAPVESVTAQPMNMADMGMGNLAGIDANHAPIAAIVIETTPVIVVSAPTASVMVLPLPIPSVVVVPDPAPTVLAIIPVASPVLLVPQQETSTISTAGPVTTPSISSTSAGTSISSTIAASSSGPSSSPTIPTAVQNTIKSDSNWMVMADSEMPSSLLTQPSAAPGRTANAGPNIKGSTAIPPVSHIGAGSKGLSTGLGMGSGAANSGSGNMADMPMSPPHSGGPRGGSASGNAAMGSLAMGGHPSSSSSASMGGPVMTGGYYGGDYDDGYDDEEPYPPGYGRPSSYGGPGGSPGLRGSPAVYTGTASKFFRGSKAVLSAAFIASLSLAISL